MQFSFKKRQQGSVLAVALITCLVIATVLASYLLLISNRYSLTMRSMDWNAAMPVLEAGIEEAMTHLQCDTNNPNANGWANRTIGGQTVVAKTRNFDDGSYADVYIANAASTTPTIYSSGFVPAPLGQGYISRTVAVTTTKPRAFPAAIAATGMIKLSEGTVDSYNSCLGAYSTNNSLGTNGSIATTSTALKAIDVGNAHIYGTVTTGPGGTAVCGGGAVGDAAWNATHSGVQTGWSDDDMNVAFPTNAPPQGGPFPPPPVYTNITCLVSDTTYQLASFTTGSMIVSGNATLYVIGKLDVSGSDFIKVLPGASLTLYVGGEAVISGGGVVNLTGQAANFSYIGLSTNVKLTVSGSAAFIGTINAPQAAFTLSGSGGVYGAAIVKSYTGSGGNSSFHYDECLGAAGDFYTITSWREL